MKIFLKGKINQEMYQNPREQLPKSELLEATQQAENILKAMEIEYKTLIKMDPLITEGNQDVQAENLKSISTTNPNENIVGNYVKSLVGDFFKDRSPNTNNKEVYDAYRIPLPSFKPITDDMVFNYLEEIVPERLNQVGKNQTTNVIKGSLAKTLYRKYFPEKIKRYAKKNKLSDSKLEETPSEYSESESQEGSATECGELVKTPFSKRRKKQETKETIVLPTISIDEDKREKIIKLAMEAADVYFKDKLPNTSSNVYKNYRMELPATTVPAKELVEFLPQIFGFNKESVEETLDKSGVFLNKSAVNTIARSTLPEERLSESFLKKRNKLIVNIVKKIRSSLSTTPTNMELESRQTEETLYTSETSSTPMNLDGEAMQEVKSSTFSSTVPTLLNEVPQDANGSAAPESDEKENTSQTKSYDPRFFSKKEGEELKQEFPSKKPKIYDTANITKLTQQRVEQEKRLEEKKQKLIKHISGYLEPINQYLKTLDDLLSINVNILTKYTATIDCKNLIERSRKNLPQRNLNDYSISELANTYNNLVKDKADLIATIKDVESYLKKEIDEKAKEEEINVTLSSSDDESQLSYLDLNMGNNSF